MAKGAADVPNPTPTIFLTMIDTKTIQELAGLIAAHTQICTKEILTSDEAARYMGVSRSYLYKLTMNGVIPHSKPNGKMCYFDRHELEQWLMRHKCNEEGGAL